MFQLIQQLTNEHSRIRGMLSCFEAQLDRFERAERPDYEILGGSIAYCRDCLDHCHHPCEEALLELLGRRAPAAARACAHLEGQHQRLTLTTGEVVKIFDEVECDAEYPRSRLVEIGRSLIENYRRHLDKEEVSFFPALRDHLLPEDWKEIRLRFADNAGPLTQCPVNPRLRSLVNVLDGR